MPRKVFGKVYKPVYDAALAIKPEPAGLTPSKPIAGAVKVESKEAKIVVHFKPTMQRPDGGAARVVIGFKVIMADDSWWLYHYKAQSWTRHDGRTKTSFGSTKNLMRDMGHCKPLIVCLLAELKSFVPELTDEK